MVFLTVGTQFTLTPVDCGVKIIITRIVNNRQQKQKLNTFTGQWPCFYYLIV